MITSSIHQTPHPSILLHSPFSQFICSPPDTSPIHSPLLLHTPVEHTFRSNLEVPDLQYPATSPRSLNGLEFLYTDAIYPSTLDSVQQERFPSLHLHSTSRELCTNSFGDTSEFPIVPPSYPLHYDVSGGYIDSHRDQHNAFPEGSTLGSWAFAGASLDPFGGNLDDSLVSACTTAASSKQKYSLSLRDTFQTPVPYTPPMFPPFPDINMFELALSMQEPVMGVNPADVSTAIPQLNEWFRDDPDPAVPLSPCTNTLEHPATNELSAEVLDELVSILSSSASDSVSPTLDNATIKTENDPDPVLVVGPSYDSTYPQELPQCTDPLLSSICPSPAPSCKKPSNKRSSQETPIDVKPDLSCPVPDLGSPVLNAHHGVLLSDLLSKAERYRLRNPGQDTIDKKWLHSFAGKLSPKGELLEDFRCYVIGCFQTNKRRDHILIHIGSHVDQRPFSCEYCSMRFLRKNERKRHEASHTGDRPYVCDICPHKEKTFVRLDLLKRHLKRTHNMDPSADKENRSSSGSVKRLKLDLDA